MNTDLKSYLNEKQIDKLIYLPEIIESSHEFDFKVLDFINTDTYRHMDNADLFDYDFILKGHPASKGVQNKPSQTNMVFYFWLAIATDLKAFGLNKIKLRKIKNYLFEEININDYVDIDLKQLEGLNIKNPELRKELHQLVRTGELKNLIEGKKLSRLFIMIFKLISSTNDIQLIIDKESNAIFVDEFELTDKQLLDLAKDSRIIIPLKQFLRFFIDEFASDDFLIRTHILSERDVYILNELKRKDIESVTIKFKEGKPQMLEVRQKTRLDVKARVADIILDGAFENIIIKTQNGNIFHSETNIKKILK